MNKNLLNITAPIIAAFALAACATQKEDPSYQSIQEATSGLAVAVSMQNDFEFVAGCNGDGKGGILSYSKARDEYRLTLRGNNQVVPSYIKPGPNSPVDELGKLNEYCFSS